jgi:hypothetical protein
MIQYIKNIIIWQLNPPSPERRGVPKERRLQVVFHGNRHLSVIPAEAGIQILKLDARFREHDKKEYNLC